LPLFPYATLFRSATGADPDALEDHHRVVVADDPVTVHVGQQLLRAVAAGIAAVGVQPPFTVAGRAFLVLVGEVAPGAIAPGALVPGPDRKSTRLNSSHVKISYAVFC